MPRSEGPAVPAPPIWKPKLKRAEAIRNEQQAILAGFTPQEQAVIIGRQKQLSALGYFIGKDFTIPILLNRPGGGAHWNAEENFIRIDAKDVLERPIEYLRYLYSHEAGHRRIDRIDLVPEELRKQPGFMGMCHAIFDPRNNNYVAESYPGYLAQLDLVYSERIPKWREAKKEMLEKQGYVPRHQEITSALFENWWRDLQGQPIEFNPKLEPEILAALNKVIPYAQDAWWRYPTKEEADSGEATVRAYAAGAYKNFIEHMWPVFEPFVKEDILDEKIQFLMELFSKGSLGVWGRVTPELGAMLSEQDRSTVETALRAAIENNKSVNPRLFSPALRSTLEKYIDTLNAEIQKEFEEFIKFLFKHFEELMRGEMETAMEGEEEINQGLETESTGTENGEQEEEPPPSRSNAPVRERDAKKKQVDPAEAEEVRNTLGTLSGNANVYETNMRQVLPIIVRLENDLREIFVHRRSHTWETGFKFGKKLDIKKRMQEKAKGVSAFESRAWQKREAPGPKDYAITLLVDLSGSMRGRNKIVETFKAVVALAEALNSLSIKLEVTGYNTYQFEYQQFNEPMSDNLREHMGEMLRRVESHGSGNTDDGWALTQASARLAKQPEAIKILIALSDGDPAPSHEHDGPEFDLEYVIGNITNNTDQKLVGLGIGSGTGHVAHYYPNSLADVPVEEMAEKLADLIRTVIEDPNSF